MPPSIAIQPTRTGAIVQTTAPANWAVVILTVNGAREVRMRHMLEHAIGEHRFGQRDYLPCALARNTKLLSDRFERVAFEPKVERFRVSRPIALGSHARPSVLLTRSSISLRNASSSR